MVQAVKPVTIPLGIFGIFFNIQVHLMPFERNAIQNIGICNDDILSYRRQVRFIPIFVQHSCHTAYNDTRLEPLGVNRDKSDKKT
jgi:hypothetical protein